MALAEKLGKLVGQILGEDVRSVSIEVEGAAAQLNQKPITGAVLAGLMGTYSDTVNMVNAPFLAKERGLDVREVRHDREGDYHTLVSNTYSSRCCRGKAAEPTFGVVRMCASATLITSTRRRES